MTPGFAEHLRRAVDVARRAPSSHNSQPWKVTHVADRGKRPDLPALPADRQAVLLSFDAGRMLKSLPSLRFEMYLSCGLFLGLLVEALEAQGYPCEAHWLCDHVEVTGTEQGTGDLVLLAVGPRGQAREEAFGHLRALADARRTVRAPFRSEPVGEADAAALLRADRPADLTGGLLNMRIEAGRAEIARVGRLVEAYGALDFSNYAAWSETYRYIHFDQTRPAEDGFYLSSLVGPVSRTRSMLMRIAFAPAVMQALRVIGLPRKLARELGALVAGSPGLLSCALPDRRPGAKALVQAGARLMEVWLNAQRLGIAVHPVSVMLQHDEPRREIETLFGEPGRVVFFARFGYAAAQAADVPSPRRPVDGVLAAI
jgi:4-hydroxy-2,2'-bipyrrole-5-methanol dehydrogenase